MSRRTRTHRSTARSVAGLVGAALSVLLACLAAGPAADAAPGTWGAGHYRYLDGRVCSDGSATSPLAAWSVSGGHPAYLTRSVTNNGPIDSAAPPIPSAGTPAAAVEVAPGSEFRSDRDIAAVAYLLSTGGDAATLAAAVLAQTDPSEMPACADTGAAYSQLSAARLAAGPYRVTVTAAAGPARPGKPLPVGATVRTNAGDPVKGVRVQFVAPETDVASASVVTGADGVAHDLITVHGGANATVTVTAAAAVATGLLEATITATPSATNPTGSAVPAVYPAPATTYSGQATITVDRTPHPVVSTALSTHLFTAGSPLTPRAQVSGLNGHSAEVSFNLLGPLPLTDRTLCSPINDGDWSAGTTQAAASSSVRLVTDGTAQGGALTPAEPGCYALRTTVATVDATPAVTKKAPLAVVAVLDTALSREDTGPAVLAGGSNRGGKLSGELRVTDPHGLRGRVEVTFTGPIRPANGDCGADAPGWDHADKQTATAAVEATESARTTLDAAGSYRYTVSAPGNVGCYRVRPSVTLSAPNGDTLTIATGDQRPAYVLKPTLTAAVQRTWSVSPAAVPVQVQVDGLYGLAAHVRTTMYVAAADPAGCARASFVRAARAATGPATAVPAQPGVVTVSVRSGATPKIGCYAVVPEVTVDADPHVHIAGAVGEPGATLIAGIDPNPHLSPAARHDDSGTTLGFLIAILVLAVVLLAVAARVALVAWHDRDGPADDEPAVLPGADPIDLLGGGLPSTP